MNKDTKMIIALVAILTVCASIAIIGVSESLSGEDSVTAIGTYYDKEGSGITFTLYSNNTAEATHLTAESKKVNIPGKVTVSGVEYKVESVSGLFGYKASVVEEVTFAASIQKIGDGKTDQRIYKTVFFEAKNLKVVKFEENSKLTYIGNGAFSGCISLETLKLPDGLKEIGTYAFTCSCSTSASDNLCKSNYSHCNLYSLKSLTLPASLEKIGEGSLPNLVMDINLSEDSTHFAIDNGILYDFNKTVIIRAFNPKGDVVIPSTVLTIYPKAFNFQTSDVMSDSYYSKLGFTTNPVTNDPTIGNVTIPSSVKYVGSYAFNLYSNGSVVSKSPYTGLTISGEMRANIGSKAFAYNPLITTMYVGEDCEVEKDAYLQCNNINVAYILQNQITKQYNGIGAKTLVLSKELTTIGNSSLKNWKNLETITYEGVNEESGVAKLPASLTSIGTDVFSGSAIRVLDLSSLENTTISGFSDIDKLEKISFSTKVTTVTGFKNLTSLTSVTFPASLTNIGDNAFTGCTHLANITFNEGLTSIGAGSFQNLTSLTSVTFPASLQTISNKAFKSCTNISTITFAVGSKLSEIGADAFGKTTSLTSIKLPGTITTIGSKAFDGCTSLTTIEFGEGITSIASGSFQKLTALTSVVFPSTLKSVGKTAFTGCTSLGTIVAPTGADIPLTAFANSGTYPDSQGTDRYLKIFTIKIIGTEDEVKRVLGIDPNVPQGTVIKIPTGVEYIKFSSTFITNIGGFELEDPVNSNYKSDATGGVLYNKSGDTIYCVREKAIINGEFTVSKDVKEIGSYSFCNLVGLEVLNFENNSNLQSIGSYAFDGCLNLRSFTSPTTLVSIEDYAFQGTGVTAVDLTAVTQNLTIGKYAFNNSSSLSVVSFPNNHYVTTGQSSFSNTAVQDISISSGSIGSYAFDGCTHLQKVTLGAGVDQTSSNYLRGTSSLKQIIILNTDSAVIGSKISADHITSGGEFVVIVPSNSQANYSTFKQKFPVSEIVVLENKRSFYSIPTTAGITITQDSITSDSVTYKYVLNAEYNRSEIGIKLGDVVVDVNTKGGTFTITPGEQVEAVSITGVQVNRYSVSFEVHNAVIKGFTSSVEHSKDITFTIVPRSGYELEDAKAIVNNTEYQAGQGGLVKIPSVTDDINIMIEGVVPASCYVTFIKDGKVIDVSQVKFGGTVESNAASTTWYLYDSQSAFDFNQAISEDLALFASQITEDSKIGVSFYAARGSMMVSWIGGEVCNEGSVLKGSDVTFTYDGGGSYGVVGWFVNGKYTESSKESITISDVTKPISIQIAVVYEQADYKYIVNAPMVLPDEDYQKMLWIGTYKDPLTPTYYQNMPSGYTVVGDYLYLVMGGKEIVRIDLNGDFSSGLPVNTIKVIPEDVKSTIKYYGGYIFNGTHVYDLELNHILDVDYEPVGMHDGKFVSLGGNHVTKYTIDKTGDGYRNTEVWGLNLEKHYGMVFIDGDYLYHLPVSTSQEEPDRAIQSIDLVNGKIKDTVNINNWQYGHYYDDGWLTVYDGWAYIASYTSGLFGETNPYVTAREPALLRVAVEDGVFDKDSVQTMILPNNTQQSGLVVYNDRGYIHSGDQLVVIDMNTFTMIYKETGTKTHGGIVLNTYYATSENNYKVYIYMVPYGGADTIWVYTDYQNKTEAGTPQKIEGTGYSQYATTHVRTSASGYIYWYNDSSIFFITGQKYHEVSWVSEGKVLQTDSQAQNGAKLTLPTAPQKEGYVFLGWYNYDGTRITEGSVVAGDMTIMAIYAPAAGDDELIDSVSIKQFVNGGMSVLLSVDAGENAPEKVLIVTYSAYIDLPEGTMLNPFLTECVEMGANETKVYFTPTLASKIESLTVTCCYEIDSILYSTPCVKAVAPTTYATVDLTIDPSLSLTLNDLTVVNGQSMRYGYYVVEVEGNDNAQYQVNGVVANGQNRLFYYGQSLVVTKVGA